MNLLLLTPADLFEHRARLCDRRARHLREVVQVSPGTRLRAGVARGPLGVVEVERVSRECVDVRFEQTDSPSPTPTIDLLLALPRPKVLRRCLLLAATMGVRNLDLINAWRVEKSFFASKVLAPDAIEAQLLLGCEQGATTWVPRVTVHRLLMPFLDAWTASADVGCRALLHPGSERSLVDAGKRETGSIAIAVGPEGGWIQREVDSFVEREFVPVRLGDAILPTYAAVVAAIAQLQATR